MIFARRRSSCASRPLLVAEHALGRPIVNVDALPERLDQRRVARQMREHAQFDLRVVRRDQHEARLGDERRANFAAERRAHRNVLQIRDRCCSAGPSPPPPD